MRVAFRFHDASRKSVTLRLKQLPLRPANAFTSYSVQSGQFKQIIIYETKPNEFYTQISRCTYGLSSILLARPLPPRFKPTANANTIAEVARLEALHIVTDRNFDAEVSMPVGRVDVVPVSLPAVTAASVGDTSQPPAASPQTGPYLHPDQSVANCSSSAFGVHWPCKSGQYMLYKHHHSAFSFPPTNPELLHLGLIPSESEANG